VAWLHADKGTTAARPSSNPLAKHCGLKKKKNYAFKNTKSVYFDDIKETIKLCNLLKFSGIIAVHPDVLGQNDRIKSTHDNR
jgi:hypothetical protein